MEKPFFMRSTFTLLLALSSLFAFAEPGDTTIVQTYTFEEQNNPNTAYDNPGRRTFEFPNDEVSYQKILMYHTLKCFEDGTAGNLGFPCGEWDYLSYNYLYKHTGVFDSIAATHPLHLWNNQNFTSVRLSETPVFDIYQFNQSHLVIDQFNSETAISLGTGSDYSTDLLGGAKQGRSQFIWTATELQGAGLTAGELDGLKMMTDGLGLVKNLTIRIKTITTSNLAAWNNDGWTLVYQQDRDFASIGEQMLYFTSPFNWNGTSNLLIDFSYTNYEESAPIPILGSIAESNTGLIYNGADYIAKINGTDQIVTHIDWANQIADQITIGFWVNGDEDFQPMDGTIFEGVNSQNQRVLNSHLPWSNGRIYWDAGWQDGTYDRIDKLAAATQYEGKWNHFAFTKNTTTGIMRIYINGTSWHAATGMNNTIEDLVRFTIGSASSWTNFYNGSIDDFTILNTALDAAGVTEMMRTSNHATASYSSSVLLNHNFNDPNYSSNDDFFSELESTFLGSISRDLVVGGDVFKNAATTDWRPLLSLVQHDHVTHLEDATVSQAITRPLTSFATYSIENNAPVMTDLSYYYLGGYAYTYSADGEKLDSTLVTTDFLQTNEILDYYQAPFEITERYEIGRYITPYGINLSLGQTGWTWVYDVTDFEPLLHGTVDLECGNWQELLDLKFVFIEGPETREVKRIENVWNGNYNLNNFDAAVTEQTLGLEEGEVGLKLRTTVTGHGFGFDNNNCGEFCYNTHSLDVNGSEQFSWEIMEDCDKNPLYPQGGTWIYARAGWCPGKEGTTQEFELTPFIQNNEVSVDYDITYDPFGNYVTESQAVYYGPIAFSNDAEIERVLAPSDWKIHSRMNPMCDEPMVVIRNKGSQPLTALTLTYRVAGGASQTYNWTGNLGFMESEAVTLSYSDPILWTGADDELMNFIVDISGDENNANNHAESKFLRPTIFEYNNLDDNRIIIILKTNNAFQETSYKLYDINDNVIFQRDNFSAANTFYRDTLQLNQGCYRFHIEDTDGDGLEFFANSDGAGQVKIDRVNGPDFRSFNPDFGKEINYYFHFNTNLVSTEDIASSAPAPIVYPNPVDNTATMRFNGAGGSYTIQAMDALGKVIYQDIWKKGTENEIQLDTNEWESGMYVITLQNKEVVYSLKLMKH